MTYWSSDLFTNKATDKKSIVFRITINADQILNDISAEIQICSPTYLAQSVKTLRTSTSSGKGVAPPGHPKHTTGAARHVWFQIFTIHTWLFTQTFHPKCLRSPSGCEFWFLLLALNMSFHIHYLETYSLSFHHDKLVQSFMPIPCLHKIHTLKWQIKGNYCKPTSG